MNKVVLMLVLSVVIIFSLILFFPRDRLNYTDLSSLNKGEIRVNDNCNFKIENYCNETFRNGYFKVCGYTHWCEYSNKSVLIIG